MLIQVPCASHVFKGHLDPVGSYITRQSQVPQAAVSTPHWLCLKKQGYKTVTATVHPISSNRKWKSWTRSIATQRRDAFQRFFTPAAVAPHLTIRSVADPFQKLRVADVSYPKSATACACMQKGLILIPSNHDYSIWWFQGYCSNIFLIISRHIKTQDSMIFKQLAAK